jgi:8-oxo-dGTP pyrophosphatase MutT (NUDIX family)
MGHRICRARCRAGTAGSQGCEGLFAPASASRRKEMQDDMPKYRTVRAFSAGGVVFRQGREAGGGSVAAGSAPQLEVLSSTSGIGAAAGAEVVLVGRASEDYWVLPKGTPAPNETTPEVALREVREETGLTTRIVSELGSIHYWFVRKGVRFNKEVFYFLMEATGGDVSLHDHEYDDARWFPVDAAQGRLTYENEADMLRRAIPLIAAQSRDYRDDSERDDGDDGGNEAERRGAANE